MKYVIITPAYNEEKYIKYILDSVIAQTVLPTKWIIVDDGSTDKTSEIIYEYSLKYKWIKLIKKDKKEKRSSGSKVVRAFNCGYKYIDVNYDIIVKLDADLTLPKNYFEKIIEEFKADDKLALCGGYCKIKNGDKWIKERTASYHVRGAFKTYRRSAFDQIGGFDEVLGWDGLDQMKLMYNGWKIKVIDLAVLHHRITGGASNFNELSYKHGIMSYKRGYDFILVLLRSIIDICRYKKITPSFFYIKGFLIASKNNEEKVVDKNLELFIRKFQYKRIFKFKI